MGILSWNVELSREARRQYEKLKRCGLKKPSIIDLIDFFVLNLEQAGPERYDWPHYGKIEKNKKFYYHCHLKKGHPTIVICWEVKDIEQRKIEVFYVGTHEKAPY